MRQRDPIRARGSVAALCVALAAMLGACGGGGGGDAGGAPAPAPPQAPAPATFNLSGTISVAETAAVDSDTNDINQARYVRNGTVATAQALSTPVLLVGSVNKPNTGPRGRNNDGGTTLGDEFDVYRADLVAGQVVELEFATDPGQSDVDLYLFDASGNVLGFSAGTTSRFECVRVQQAGTFYVVVQAFLGASVYNLRIGAPGTGAGCAQSTAAQAFPAGQLILEPRRAAADTAGLAKAAAEREATDRGEAWLRAAGARPDAGSGGQPGRLVAGIGPQVVRLQADAQGRSEGLARLAQRAAGKTGTQERPPAVVPALHAAAMADPWPEALQTLLYAKALRATGAFEYVEPNFRVTRQALLRAFPPNDRAYPLQRWHYEQIALPEAINRINALNPPATQPRPLVAVVDSGVMLEHVDLAPQLFSNGRTFLTFNSEGDGDRATGNDPATAGTPPPVFHGTHVAGTAAAATFDGIGGAGVAPMALILPVRVLRPSEDGRDVGTFADIIQGMRYAAGLPNRSGTVPPRRADVMNVSISGRGACDGATATAVSDVRAAGTLVVVAAGNNAENAKGRSAPVGTPANCPGAIAVSATDALRGIARYSNSGPQIRVAAPGGDVDVSTTGTGAPDGVHSAVGTFDASGRRLSTVSALDGTSMASPHVAGVLALMRYVNPALTVAQVEDLLAAGRLTDEIGAAGRDDLYGFGLINARKAVDAALATLATPPAQPAVPLVASPSTIDFGSMRTSAVIELVAPGQAAETFSGAPQVVPGPGLAAAAVTVSATRVNAGGLGVYTVRVDRNAIATPGTYFPTVRFTLSSGRSLAVQLSVVKPAVAGTGRGDFGPIYVLLIDPATGRVEHTVRATHANGLYTWSKTGYAKPKVQIVAGGDTDNDDFICARGEACGAFPVLEVGGGLRTLDLTGNRDDLNFPVAPVGGVSAAATEAPAARAGWRRTGETP